MNGSLSSERTIEQATGTISLAPPNNSNCYTRGPVELQAYESCYTTGEKRTIEQTTAAMPLAPNIIATATLEDQLNYKLTRAATLLKKKRPHALIYFSREKNLQLS